MKKLTIASKYYTFLLYSCKIAALVMLFLVAALPARAQTDYEELNDKLFTVGRFDPARSIMSDEKNGYILSNVKISGDVGKSPWDITSFNDKTKKVAAFIEFISADVEGYRYNGEIYNSYKIYTLQEGAAVPVRTVTIDEIKGYSLTVGGQVAFDGVKAASFEDKQAISPASVLVWESEDIDIDISSERYTIENLYIISTKNSYIERKIENMLKLEQQNKEKAEKERKKEGEAKQKEKETKGDDNSSDEGTSQIVVSDSFWSNGGETEDAAENKNTGDGGFWTNGGSEEETSTSEGTADDGFWANGGTTTADTKAENTNQKTELSSSQEYRISYVYEGYWKIQPFRPIYNQVTTEAGEIVLEYPLTMDGDPLYIIESNGVKTKVFVFENFLIDDDARINCIEFFTYWNDYIFLNMQILFGHLRILYENEVQELEQEKMLLVLIWPQSNLANGDIGDVEVRHRRCTATIAKLSPNIKEILSHTGYRPDAIFSDHDYLSENPVPDVKIINMVEQSMIKHADNSQDYKYQIIIEKEY